MEDNTIIIHQAYYGEVNKSHGCIKQTISDLEISSALLSFTDRPGSIPPGIELTPYLSGGRFEEFYIIAKTYPDNNAKRSGMVFSHVLILRVDDVVKIKDIQEVISIFGSSIPPNRADELKPIQFQLIPVRRNSSENQIPKYLEEVILQLINGRLPIYFSGKINSFEYILSSIWKSMYPLHREKLKFRASFTPTDIEGKDDITIVSIQEGFLPKWNGYTVVSDKQEFPIEVKNDAVGMFLGDKEESSFNTFLFLLDASISDFKQYGQYYQLYETSKQLNESVNSNNLRQSIRLLSILLPSPKSGVELKRKFINKLEQLIQTGQDDNIAALRNLNVAAFQDGEKFFSRIVSNFLKDSLNNVIYPEFSSDLEIAVSRENDTSDWWHKSFKNTLVEASEDSRIMTIKNLWGVISNSAKNAVNLFKILPGNRVIEENLKKNIPQKIDKDAFESILDKMREHKWFSLYAEVLLTKYTPIEGLPKILEVENTEPLIKSIGVNYIASKVGDKTLLQLALESGDNKLIELSAERISGNKALLSSFDLSQSIWMLIWEKVLEKTKDINYGLEGRLSNIVNSLLNYLLNDKQVPEIVIECIAGSKFADLSGHQKRELLLNKIPSKYKEKFLFATVGGLIDKLGNATISKSEIEPDLLKVMKTDNYVSDYLQTAPIEMGMRIFQSLSLSDDIFAKYLSKFNSPIKDELGKLLGKFIFDFQFKISAGIVFQKSKYITGYKAAYEECKSLVPIDVRNLQLPKVVILTAIKEEYLAVQKHLRQLTEIKLKGALYERGVFLLDEKPVADVIIRECGQKSIITSEETAEAINSFSPDCMLFIGIAGSTKPVNFGLGDVIFPDKIYFYEGAKDGKTFFKSRPESEKPSFELLEIAKVERRKNDWKVIVKGMSCDNPNVNIGVIASGDKLIEHIDSNTGKILAEHYNDTSAVEMEGYSFLSTVKRRGGRKLIYGVVRGISDILEQENGTLHAFNQDRRPINAKEVAANNAAAFGFWLVYKLFESSSR